jgi:hypothetical protein
VDDIDGLNTLQTIVPACGQVRFSGVAHVYTLHLSKSYLGVIAVSSVLLDVRYGKYAVRALDELSYRRGARTSLPERYEAPLGVSRTRVVVKSTPALTEADRRGGPALECGIDTEVGSR